jgi:hypothetical protein
MLPDSELRALVRDAIARHAGRGRDAAESSPSSGPHPSHDRFALLRSGDDEGACLIEPSVRCNHCGYCVSQGH